MRSCASLTLRSTFLFLILGSSAFAGDTLTLGFDAGNNVGGILDFSFPRDFRVEGEISYRDNNLDAFSIASDSLADDGNVWALSLMANAFYDLDLGGPVKPYAVGGLGFARVKLDELFLPGFGTVMDSGETVFAYQLGAGAAWKIDSSLAVTFDYRWFRSQDPTLTALDGSGVNADYSSHNLGIGLRYGF